MQRYFIPSAQFSDDQCILQGQDAHHLKNVIRANVGDRIVCSDGEGRSAIVQMKSFENRSVICHVVEHLDEQVELPVYVTIAQSLPKGDKLDWILQKGTELGAHRFIPFSSARTVVKYDRKKEHKKHERWTKIVKEAAEQAHRSRLPVVEPVYSFSDLLQHQADHKWVAYEKEELRREESATSAFAQALSAVQAGEHVIIVIGPEGGLEESEVKQLNSVGFLPISLGHRILRTETASPYVLSSISFYFEQMGG